MKTLRSERELINYLKMMREQSEDPALATAGTPAPAPAPAPSAGAPADPSGQPPTERKPITVDDIIERINTVRSGKSIKDENVRRELDEYVNQFNEDEKTALLAFLEGLGQILTSGIDSVDAADPADPYALQIKKSLGASSANASRTPSPSTAASPSPAPGPVPIRVGGV
jgi:hypothetical protein